MEKRKYYQQCDICGDRFERSDASRDLGSETDWLCVDCHMVQNLDYKALIDRLIKRSKADESGSSFATICSRNDLRLAASAITDLLSRAEELRKISTAYADIKEILGDNYDLSRLRDLVRADKEGKCEIFPCKVGDIVYVVNRGDYYSRYEPYISEKEIIEINWKKDRKGKDLGFGLILKGGNYNTSARYKISSIGKTVFLTRGAAEAALKERKKDE